MSDPNLSSRRKLLIIVLFAAGLSFLAIPYIRPDNVPVLFLFLGRLHPLILHFPIVLIMLALALEISKRYFFPAMGELLSVIILSSAALASAVSVGAGYFLFASGDYAGNLIEAHLWAGVITGALTLMTLSLYLLYSRTGRYYPMYFTLLIISNAAVGYASHLGGSVTHGQGYLTEHLRLMLNDSNQDTGRAEGQALVFQDMLTPIIEAKCASCHNAQRAKGGLRLTAYQDMFKSGDSDNPGIRSGAPEQSEVFKRILLPDGHKDHMPPEGKTPMDTDEIALLRGWVLHGASDTVTVEDFKRADTLGAVLTRLGPKLKRYRMKAEMARLKISSIQSDLERIGETLNVVITRDSSQVEPLFALAMKFPPVAITNENLSELRPFFEHFSKVSLSSAGLVDDQLYYVGQMTNVRELYLQKNGFDGSGLIYLQDLQQLEVLNLSFTKIDDKSALDLLKIPNLKTVYLYRTNTSQQVVDALQKNKPTLTILMEEGPLF